MYFEDVILELKAIKAFLYRNRFDMGYRDVTSVVKWLDDVVALAKKEFVDYD